VKKSRIDNTAYLVPVRKRIERQLHPIIERRVVPCLDLKPKHAEYAQRHGFQMLTPAAQILAYMESGKKQNIFSTVSQNRIAHDLLDEHAPRVRVRCSAFHTFHIGCAVQ
jgi:hypothetical protein